MRYLVTGGSGYIGSRLVQRLAMREGTERIVLADVRPPGFGYRPKIAFERLDVRDRAAARALLERSRPDALVHLAFILDPVHDEALMYDVDVNGTQNVLDAASAAAVGQVLVTSSTSAYGAFPDNPVPLTEEDPVRGAPDFSYARDKAEADRLCQLWAAGHPDRVTTIARPCIVFGPNVDNSIVRLWTKQAFATDLGNLEGPIQFVHEDDLGEALMRLLEGRHGGAFNVTGEGVMTQRECAELAGLTVRRLPLGLARALARAAWKLRVSEAPPGQIDFGRFPWIASNDKLKRTLGWTPEHTSREAFEAAMRAKGRVPAGGSEGRDPAAILAA